MTTTTRAVREPATSDRLDAYVRDLQQANPVVAKKSIRTDRAADLRDSSPEQRVAPCLVVYPDDVVTVQMLVALAAEHRLPIIPRGARTGLVGGATPLVPSLVIDVSRMKRVTELDLAGRYAHLEPGVLLGEIENLLTPHGMMYPPDPASYRRATIGGTVATNAGGLRCVKYGVTADWVRTLDVVLPNGELVRMGHRVIKDATSLNLTQLFIGSEGTLGVIVGVGITFCPTPPEQHLAIFGFGAIGDAIDAVIDMQQAVTPGMCELVDAEALRHRDTLPLVPFLGDIDSWGDDPTLLLIQVEGAHASADMAQVERTMSRYPTRSAPIPPAAVANILDVRRGAQSRPSRDSPAHGIEESLAQAVSSFASLPQDLSVPLPKLNSIIRHIRQVAYENGVDSRIVAHVGDGNIHLLLVGRASETDRGADAQVLAATMYAIVTEVIACGGTVSGEHGIGSLKQDWAMLDLGDEVAELQRTIKRSIDPLGIMNPGKLYGEM